MQAQAEVDSKAQRIAALQGGEPVVFTCHGNNAPAYGCNKPGDMSGTYYKAPQPVVPDGIPDLAIFLAIVWRQVDEFVYANCTGDQLMQYPVIQGTHNQLQLMRVATLPYDKQQVYKGIQALLSAAKGGDQP
jgi:hypothetical protein